MTMLTFSESPRCCPDLASHMKSFIIFFSSYFDSHSIPTSLYMKRPIILLYMKVMDMQIRNVHDGRIRAYKELILPISRSRKSAVLFVLILVSSLSVSLQNPYYVPVPDPYNHQVTLQLQLTKQKIGDVL